MFYFVLTLIQLSVTVIVGLYFYRQLKGQNAVSGAGPAPRDSHQALDRLHQMRSIRLTPPLNERVRPARMEDIVGQAEGIQALKAALCSENPQHVLIYGPPGIGKTCAARLVLEEARKQKHTPFLPDAPFIEMDATCVRFDERAIADPLIGSVHDPIYQGAGQLGINGVPQPKEGAVTRAHGGVLFLDEIGELHPMQMNKLLKVLEDRKVRLESAYYDPDDRRIPKYIHDIFANGLPADFRLVGATTRSPSDIPPALRSRCMEVFFRPLEGNELALIARDAARKAGYQMGEAEAQLIGGYCANGREAVNIVQMAVGLAQGEKRRKILRSDVEWVIECGRYEPQPRPERREVPAVGLVNALAVQGVHQGAVMPIEAVALPGTGKVKITGVVEQEELSTGHGQTLRRAGTAKNAADNALTVLRAMGLNMDQWDLHINFPGGAPVDGPSAGAAMALAGWSAVTGVPLAWDAAITGELSVCGRILPVGGVPQKIGAAERTGLRRVLIPEGNHRQRHAQAGIRVLPVRTLKEVIELMAESSRAIDAPEGIAPLASLAQRRAVNRS